jgi:amino acid permease
MREYWRTETMLDAGKGTVLSSTLVLANTVIGAGVLSLPYAVKECGLLLGCGLIVAMALLIATTQKFIVYGCLEHRPRSYEELVRSLFGVAWGTFMELVVFTYQFGACIAYQLVIYDQAKPLLVQYVGEDSAFARPTGGLIAAGLLVLPLCIQRELDVLKYTSFLGVLAPLFLCGVLAYRGIEHLADAPSIEDALSGVEMVNWENPTGAFIAVPIFCFALNSHVMVPSVYAELQPRLKRPKTFSLATLCAYAIVLLIYVPAAGFGYIVCGSLTPDEILKQQPAGHRCFADGDTLIQACRGVIAIAGFCCYPLNHFPGRSAVFNILFKDAEAPPSTAVFNLEGVLWVAATTTFAILVPQIHVVFDLLGATCASTLMFIFPALIWWRLGRGSCGEFCGTDGLPANAALDDVVGSRYRTRSSAEDVAALGFEELGDDRAGGGLLAPAAGPAAGSSAERAEEGNAGPTAGRPRCRSSRRERRTWWRAPVPAISVFYIALGVIICVLGTATTVAKIVKNGVQG